MDIQQKLADFQNKLHNGIIYIQNQKLNECIKEYAFFFISEIDDKLELIDKKIKESSVIIIDQLKLEGINENLIIISLNQTIIIFKEHLISNFENLFNNNSNLPIFYLTKQNYNENFKPQNKQFYDDDIFPKERSYFIKYLDMQKVDTFNRNLWENIRPSIAGYLIKQAYVKVDIKQSSIFQNNDYNSKSDTQKWTLDDFAEIRYIGYGSCFKVFLIYHFESEELFAIKKPYIQNIDEISKLIDRQINNYSNICHPLIPKLYYTFKNDSRSYLIFQYIKGSSLSNLDRKDDKKIQLKYEEKIKIIYEIINTIEYLHKNNFIYRDLKPDNVIIDENKNSFIIDFDEMIKYPKLTNNQNEHKNENENYTNDFFSPFVAPEVNKGQYSYKNDIYSIGQMIYYIMNEEFPTEQEKNNYSISRQFNYSTNI